MTREIGSVGTHIAQGVAKRLGYDFVRQEIIAEAARLYEANPDTLVATVEDRPRMFEARKAAARRHFAFVAAFPQTISDSLGNLLLRLKTTATLLSHTGKFAQTANSPRRNISHRNVPKHG